MARALLVTGLLMMLAGPSRAADRFVSIFGDDTGNDCLSSATPCDTLAYTVAQAASGDVIKATQGPYVETLLFIVSTTLTFSGGWSFDFTSRDPLGKPSILQGDPSSSSTLLTVRAGTGDVMDLSLDGFALNGAVLAVDALTQDDGILTLRFTDCAVRKNRHRTFIASSEQTSSLNLIMSGCTVSANRSVTGGIVNLSSVDASTLAATLDDVVIERNRGSRYSAPTDGLRIYAQDTSTLSMVGTNVTVAKTVGGGIAASTSLFGTPTCTVQLTNATVRDNRGSGVRVGGAGTSLTLTNGVIARNRTRGSVGGVGGLRLNGGVYSVVNTTIRGNKSYCCTGGMHLESGSVDVSNTIVWDNRTTTGPADDLAIGTATVDLDHSDIGTSSGSYNDLGGNISVDPLFASRRDDHLAAGSPAMDTGTCSGAPITDFEGDARPTGAGCDMGADEVAP